MYAADVHVWNSNSITLHLMNQDADCLCCFDYSLEVSGQQVAVDEDLEICLDVDRAYDYWPEVGNIGGPDEASLTRFYEEVPDGCFPHLRIPLGTEPEGIRCDYSTSAGTTIESCVDHPDGLHADCVDSCPNGYTCENVPELDRSYCMQPCEDDGDCLLDGFSCDDSLCRLSETRADLLVDPA